MHGLERQVEEERRLGHGVGVDDIDGLARERDRRVFPLVLPRDLRAVGLVAARRRVAVEVVAAGVVREVVLAAGVEAVERVEAAEGRRELVLVEALCEKREPPPVNRAAARRRVRRLSPRATCRWRACASRRAGSGPPSSSLPQQRPRVISAREYAAARGLVGRSAAALTVRRHAVARAGRDPVVHAVVQRVAPREERHARRAAHALHVVCAGTRAGQPPLVLRALLEARTRVEHEPLAGELVHVLRVDLLLLPVQLHAEAHVVEAQVVCAHGGSRERYAGSTAVEPEPEPEPEQQHAEKASHQLQS